jgi:hypothetical protein
MARTRTGAELLADLRYLADLEGQTARHPDANLLRELNQSIAAYRREHPDWYSTQITGTATAGTNALTYGPGWDTIDSILRLAVSFPDSTTQVLYPFESRERYDYTTPLLNAQGWPSFYRLEGAQLLVIPTPSSAFAWTAQVLAQQTELTTVTSFDPVRAGGENVVLYDTAIRIATRDQSPRVSALVQLREDAARQLASGDRAPQAARRIDTYGRQRALRDQPWRRYS